jgi:acyl-CoA dehydrogenase
LRRGAFGRSVLMAGAAQGVYAHAARYASERRQFGKPLAAMRAVQQQLAELAAEASAMTVAAEAAAAAVDLDPAESWPLDAARIRIAGAAGTVAAIGHQILGAIGFTDEHPLHRLTTRLWAWREEYGNHAIWSERLGSVLAGKDGLTLWQRMTR